jgi:hypothetical protein
MVIMNKIIKAYRPQKLGIGTHTGSMLPIFNNYPSNTPTFSNGGLLIDTGESLILPSSVLPITEGTIEIMVYVTSTVLNSSVHTVIGNTRVDNWLDDNIVMYFASGSLYVMTSNNAGTHTTPSTGLSGLTVGWHQLTIRWSSTDLSVIADKNVAGKKSIANPTLPNENRNFQIGSCITNATLKELNSNVKNIVISNKYRTDAEVAVRDLNNISTCLDSNVTYYAPLTSDLSAYYVKPTPRTYATLTMNGGSFTHWLSALTNLGNGTNTIYDICMCGDSITEGLGTNLQSNIPTRSFVGRMRKIFTDRYGDVGVGFIPVWWPFGSPLWTFTGTWGGNYWFGLPGGKDTNTNGDTANITFTGTGFEILTLVGPNVSTISVSIDSGTPTTINLANGQSGSDQIPSFVTVASGLTQGTHTLNITNASATGPKYFGLSGGRPLMGTKGIRLNNMGHAGALVKECTDNGVGQYINNYNLFNPTLTVISYGANDFAVQESIANFTSYYQTLITAAKAKGDVLLVNLGMRSDVASPTILQSSYMTALSNLAATNNVPFLDMNAYFGADPANRYLDGLIDSSKVHYMDRMSYLVAEQILNALSS